MVFSPPQEPTRRLCGYDAVVLVVHPENPKLRMNQYYVAHFQDHLRLPSLSPITVPFDEKLDVAMFVFSSKRHGMLLRIDEGLLDKNWRPSQKTAVETKVSRMWCSGYICVLSCLAFIYNQHHENDINSIFQLPHLGAPQACGLALRTLGPAFDSILLVRRQLLR